MTAHRAVVATLGTTMSVVGSDTNVVLDWLTDAVIAPGATIAVPPPAADLAAWLCAQNILDIWSCDG